MHSLEDDRAYLLKKKAQGYAVKIINTGDTIAAASPTERAALAAAKSGAGMHEDFGTLLDQAYISRCDDYVKFYKDFIGDYLAMLSGHHLWVFTRHDLRPMNNDQYLARALKADYLGYINTIVLRFENIGVDYFILANHGQGAGNTPGTSLNKRYRIHQGFDVDMVIQGHDNTRAAGCHNFLTRNGWCEKRSVCIGAHEMAYPDDINDHGYVEKAVMLPKTLGNAMHLFEEWQGKLRVRSLV
jgi:hypothetical protein